jgi:hypothetical protein
MQNPNWNKPEAEVANKLLTRDRDLWSEWTPVKKADGTMLRVTVPGDTFLYVVDEQALALKENPKEPYKGMNWNARPDANKQVVLQIHKWLSFYEWAPPKSSVTFFPVGDWVVGERIFATRGEYVGLKKVMTHVPIWSPEKSEFILAGKPVRGRPGTDTRPAEEVGYIEAGKAPLLVDFEGGTMTYHHGAPPPKSDDGTPAEEPKPSTGGTATDVKAPAATEVLLLTPEGKLVARSSAEDETDEKRVAREKDFTRRVKDATEGKEKEKEKEHETGGKPMP